LDRIKFVYLAYGPRQSIETELKYSIAALLAEIPEAVGDIVVFTDRPERYSGRHPRLQTIDIAADLAEYTLDWKYPFRAKPCVLLRALRMFQRPCVFMDTDSFVERGFAESIQAQMKAGRAVMNRYLRPNPFPQLAGCQFALPSGGAYRYDPANALMYNSGLIAVQPRHASAIEDSIALIDQLWTWRLFAHDIEQFAINESFRLHGFAIAENSNTFVHYCAHWRKRYMHWRLARLPRSRNEQMAAQRPPIRLSKTRTRIFKRLSQSADLIAHSRAALAAYAGAYFGKAAPEPAMPVK
jgi:hypothetical protein